MANKSRHITHARHTWHGVDTLRWRSRCKIYQTFTIFHLFRTVI